MAESNTNMEEQTETTEAGSVVSKHTKLPMGRIKTIMKFDPDVNIISNEAVFAVTKATELFIEAITKETCAITAKGKRKTVTKKDFQTVLDTLDCLCFAEGALDT